MNKLVLSVLFPVMLVSVIAACHAEAQPGSSLKKGEVYRSLNGKDSLRVVSKDEIEDEDGIVARYTVEGDKVRVVVTALGMTQAHYLEITRDGLVKEKSGEILYSSANYESAKARNPCHRVKYDLANLAIASEAYFYDPRNDDTSYTPVVTRNADGSSNLPGFSWSDGVVLVSYSTDGKKGFRVTASHPDCKTGPFTWDSANGGLQ